MKKVAKKRPTTVAEYIAAADPKAKPMLRELRVLVKKAAPKALEKIGYGMPYYNHHGMFVSFGAFKDHVSVFSMSNTFLTRHGKDAKKYQTSVGTMQFSLGTKLPKALLLKLLKARAKENEMRVKKKK